MRIFLHPLRLLVGGLSLALLSALATELPWGSSALGQMTGSPAQPGLGTGDPLFPSQGGQGGATQADFESLIELLTTTVRPASWDRVGGAGSIAPFPTGVMADPRAALQQALAEEGSSYLAALRRLSAPRPRNSSHQSEQPTQIAPPHDSGTAPNPAASDARLRSPLRKVSLPRLERQILHRLAAGRTLDDEIQCLAGLERIRYVFVYPESGDLVVAGPAALWKREADRLLAVESGFPLLRLDDLIVLLRQAHTSPSLRFGCAITPRQEALARVQEYLDQTSQRPLTTRERPAWIAGLRASVGRQDVSVYGIDPCTRAARVLVEADYHMKLIGMGLAEGVPGVESYLDLVQVRAGQSPPPMEVLRWWFTMHYEALGATADRCAFALRGQGVKVLSENELLAADGQRVHTGQSEAINRKFAQSFTDNFAELCGKYPIYAELRNIFDLALLAALIGQERLDLAVGWPAAGFRDAQAIPVELAPPPETVESVVNHRVINRVHVLAGVSGGVSANPLPLLARKSMAVEGLPRPALAVPPKAPPAEFWWWD